MFIGSIFMLFGIMFLIMGFLIISELKKSFPWFHIMFSCKIRLATLFLSIPIIVSGMFCIYLTVEPDIYLSVYMSHYK